MEVTRIVCAPDSFKGSVTAAEAAAAMARGAREICTAAEILELPFADGGEGTLDALLAVWGRPAAQVETVDALGRPTTARYGLSPDGRTAVVEAAEANGLPQVSDVPLQPLRADTYGVGRLLAHVLDAGVEEILLCIGGSATTDGGTGILSALGAELLDDDGAPVAPGGQGLADIVRIDLDGLHPRARQVRWRIAVDVDNPLTGERGAAAVFGPQKGADAEDIAVLDAGLRQLAAVLAEHTETEQNSDAEAAQQPSPAQTSPEPTSPAQTGPAQLETVPGFGAAGGIPLPLVTLFGAEVVPGSAMVAEAVRLQEALEEADLVLTGEGRLDSQSLGGKVVDAVASRAPQRAAVVVIAGALQLSPAECRDAGLTAAFSIADGPAELAQLQSEAERLIQQTTAHACALLGR
ncbi:glycerate kinase [Nesterenkonia sp.]|uniref:glycerate kinase n=1 Tax=Nesterenkonia sp. TaxID=704201 RepID=UPI00260FD907|nr:glycerate kinase [Nesterenkonia sp.]